ncbi:LOW QUALITY PROTEIN: hypothetical protein CVT26_011996 [Gymnopilus dilepis]|uniref:DUF6589 domain-containing protein n=1 Tax=Gymnopilus dilepis TaxID=231916 RepID=A0A409YHQ0_9AGAR|nr:LOW QUALITY PROTEIN: hypothetical protein CVT26_011996 [Gymnopilus dilepis]
MTANSNGRFRLSDTPIPSTPRASNGSWPSAATPLPSSDFIIQTPLQLLGSSSPLILGASNARRPPTSPSSSRPSKRRKENIPPLPCRPPIPALQLPKHSTSSSRKAYTPRRSPADKLAVIFAALQNVNWNLGEFLYYVFLTKDEEGKDISRSTQHSMYASHFLRGTTEHTVSTILKLWFRSADGRSTSSDLSEMYSTSVKYTEIKPARAALTSFAAQIVEKELVREAKNAVKPSSGLHATLKRRGSQRVEWIDFSTDTVSRVQDVIKHYQPLLWHYTNKIAEGEVRKSGTSDYGGQLRRQVCTHVISTLDFSRNNEARLLPLSRGLLYFAHSAPADLMSYGSRVGDMVAYTTVHRSLNDLATYEAINTREHARDPTKFGFLQFDNVQNYMRQRDHRMGRVNKMNIGIAATYCELEDMDPSWADLDDRRRRVAENKRTDLTVDALLKTIDQSHLDLVFSLHWLRVLINSIPELSRWKEHVAMLFRKKAKKLQLPIKQTRVHPLASSGKNETITTELKEGLCDFLEQLGQVSGDYLPRIFVASGDGLTFQKMLEIQRYLQFHSDPFQSLELLEPVLSVWHTEWTDVSRVFEAHWDSSVSRDPSSLGHSAALIGRPAPSSLKKVDYYPSVDLMYLVLEVRMLDCWRNHFKCSDIFEHFKMLDSTKTLPEIEDLIPVARKLHRAFTSTRAIYHALSDTTATTPWSAVIPLGSPWTPLTSDASSENFKEILERPSKGKKKELVPPTRHAKGDRVLANSITFMRDALMSRELSYAIAEGDAGRVYEIMKKITVCSFSSKTQSSSGKDVLPRPDFISRKIIYCIQCWTNSKVIPRSVMGLPPLVGSRARSSPICLNASRKEFPHQCNRWISSIPRKQRRSKKTFSSTVPCPPPMPSLERWKACKDSWEILLLRVQDRDLEKEH